MLYKSVGTVLSVSEYFKNTLQPVYLRFTPNKNYLELSQFKFLELKGNFKNYYYNSNSYQSKDKSEL